MGSESQSFVEVDPKSHFPIQNLPYGIFKHSRAPQPRVGVAIGEFVLDLAELEVRGFLPLVAIADLFFLATTSMA